MGDDALLNWHRKRNRACRGGGAACVPRALTITLPQASSLGAKGKALEHSFFALNPRL